MSSPSIKDILRGINARIGNSTAPGHCFGSGCQKKLVPGVDKDHAFCNACWDKTFPPKQEAADDECPGCESGVDADAPHHLDNGDWHPQCCTRAAIAARQTMDGDDASIEIEEKASELGEDDEEAQHSSSEEETDDFGEDSGDEWVPSDNESDDEELTDVDEEDEEDIQDVLQNEPIAPRQRHGPKRFADEEFLKGANNGYTAGRKIDGGHSL